MTITDVLLIDDEEQFLNNIRKLLEKRSCHVFAAVDGWQGIQVLKEKCIDVVVLDIKMPGIDGVEVLRHIRNNFPLVEVLMLTGHASMDSVINGLRLGAFDYLTKPCEISLLRQKIQEAHEKRTAMLEKIKQGQSAAVHYSKSKHADPIRKNL